MHPPGLRLMSVTSRLTHCRQHFLTPTVCLSLPRSLSPSLYCLSLFHCLFASHCLPLSLTQVSFCHCLPFYFKDFIYLSLDRGEGQEKERQRNINMWPPLKHSLQGTWPTNQAHALTGNRTDKPLVRRPALNPLSHTSQGCLPFHLSVFPLPDNLLITLSHCLSVSVPHLSFAVSPQWEEEWTLLGKEELSG